jgi:glycosyltransferase involved in cell wall biosynthesis
VTADLPLVSIVVPSFNQGEFLAETLESIFSQDYASVEVMVIDGGSTDGSQEIIERYAGRLASWRSGPDRGQADALNSGFARAKGELLGWVNSDDVLLPGALTAAVNALLAHPDALLVYGANRLIDVAGTDLGLLPARPFDVPEMLRTAQNHVVQPGSLFRRSAWELAGPLAVDGQYYFDFQFVVAVGAHGPAVVLDRAVALYRLHAGSKTMSEPLRKAVDARRTVDAIFDRRDLSPEIRGVERAARAAFLATAGEYFHAALSPGLARRSLAASLWLRPRRRTAALLVHAAVPGWVTRWLRERRRYAAHA